MAGHGSTPSTGGNTVTLIGVEPKQQLRRLPFRRAEPEILRTLPLPGKKSWTPIVGQVGGDYLGETDDRRQAAMYGSRPIGACSGESASNP